MTERLTSQKKGDPAPPPSQKTDPSPTLGHFCYSFRLFPPLFPPAATEAGRRRRGTHEIIIRGAKKATEVAKKICEPEIGGKKRDGEIF